MHYVSLQTGALRSGREELWWSGVPGGCGDHRVKELLGKAEIYGFTEEMLGTKALFTSSHIILDFHVKWVLPCGPRIFFPALSHNSWWRNSWWCDSCPGDVLWYHSTLVFITETFHSRKKTNIPMTKYGIFEAVYSLLFVKLLHLPKAVLSSKVGLARIMCVCIYIH